MHTQFASSIFEGCCRAGCCAPLLDPHASLNFATYISIKFPQPSLSGVTKMEKADKVKKQVEFYYDDTNPQHDHLHAEIVHAGLLGPKLLGCVDTHQ